jgi:anti-anti-sigma factor
MSARVARTGLAVEDLVWGGRRTLILTGELDLASAPMLNATLLKRHGHGTNKITLDLSRLTSIDSTGLRCVLSAKELSESHGYEFMLIPGPRHIQRFFERSGVLDILPFRGRPRGCLGLPAGGSGREEERLNN